MVVIQTHPGNYYIGISPSGKKYRFFLGSNIPEGWEKPKLSDPKFYNQNDLLLKMDFWALPRYEIDMRLI